MTHWRSEGSARRNSLSDNSAGDEEDQFRGRSKSLDCNTKRPAYVRDCEATYRIFDAILKEGIVYLFSS